MKIGTGASRVLVIFGLNDSCNIYSFSFSNVAFLCVYQQYIVVITKLSQCNNQFVFSIHCRYSNSCSSKSKSSVPINTSFTV